MFGAGFFTLPDLKLDSKEGQDPDTVCYSFITYLINLITQDEDWNWNGLTKVPSFLV